ncbi:MAG: hypothetical protein DRG78_17065 [Epsilonproteobacteria bacterium]|nr:MAG: hypothetical protein DRG78_17065 [Campylobacterota bacterium]
MSNIPSDAVKIEVAGATVDFFELAQDGVSTYYFDTSAEGPPHPMVNAMSGLKLIKNTANVLIMINHKAPGGLFAKLDADVKYEPEDIDGGLVKVTFSSINAGVDSDLDQASCHG